jgi:hypothetical protein
LFKHILHGLKIQFVHARLSFSVVQVKMATKYLLYQMNGANKAY